MLGLTKQVGGNIGRVGGVIGNDQHLGRTGDHVDIDRAERQLLGCRNKGVAGPTILSTCGIKPAP